MGRSQRQHEQRLLELVMQESRMTPNQRLAFSLYIHKCKATGDKGTANDRGDFTLEELRAKAAEFLGI